MYPLGELSGHTPARKETDIKGTACWPYGDSLNEELGPYVRLVAANGQRHQDEGEGLPGVPAKPACTCEGTSTSMGMAMVWLHVDFEGPVQGHMLLL